MSYNLFIDDERIPTDVTWGVPEFYQVYPWIIANTYQDFVHYLLYKGCPQVISFDHDLGKDEPTGYDIAKALINHDQDYHTLPKDFKFFVHSKNPVGAENITKLLNNYLRFIGQAN